MSYLTNADVLKYAPSLTEQVLPLDMKGLKRYTEISFRD